MGAVAYGTNLKPALDVDSAMVAVTQAKAAKAAADQRLADVSVKILNFETRTDMAAPMGLQREYTDAVKAANKANANVSRAESNLKTAMAKARKKN